MDKVNEITWQIKQNFNEIRPRDTEKINEMGKRYGLTNEEAEKVYQAALEVMPHPKYWE